MRVYFGTSPRIKEKFSKEVNKIYQVINDLGHTHTSNFASEVAPEKFYNLSQKQFDDHHKETLKAIKKADTCVFEASVHSLSIGYLINFSLDLGKPVIVLAQAKTPPFMLKNLQSENFFFVTYTMSDVKKKLDKVLQEASESVDVRFNFFVTPRILAYLDWISRKKRTPRAVYLRSLIEKDMRKNKEYHKEA